jgi:hypothetical protein
VRVGDHLDVRGVDGSEPVIDVRDSDAGAADAPVDLVGDGDGGVG